MSHLLKEFKVEYHLTAAGCSAQNELPLETLVRQIIEIATNHANILGIGYRELLTHRNAWVLSRLSIEIYRMPKMHETYIITTWIENFNRFFSKRNFELTLDNGKVIGRISTVWAAINIDTRKQGDLSMLKDMDSLISSRECELKHLGKIKPVTNPEIEKSYCFQTTDIDFNRHVTTARYVELIQNQLSLEFYDRNSIRNFEIAFHHEAIWGEKVNIISQHVDSTEILTSIINSESNILCVNRMVFVPR